MKICKESVSDSAATAQAFFKIAWSIISAFLGGIQPYPTINARRLLVHISTTVHSFIHLSDLERCRVKKLAQGFNTTAQDPNLGSGRRESKALPLSHCVLIIDFVKVFTPISH